MKQRLIILIISGILIPSFLVAQEYKETERYQNDIWNVWSININAGATSFYGDLSSYDKSFIDKLSYESGPALGLMLTRHFNRMVAISGQVLAGRLKGSAHNISFKSEIFEYNIQIRLNLYNLFVPNNNSKFGFTAFGGIGNFLFNSTKTTYYEGGYEDTEHSSRVPEFIYLGGAGIHYQPSNNFAITTELSIRQEKNDKLDVEVKNNNFDYSYFAIGFTYYLRNIKKSPVKNKARIAHDDKKKKPLSNTSSRY